MRLDGLAASQRRHESERPRPPIFCCDVFFQPSFVARNAVETRSFATTTSTSTLRRFSDLGLKQRRLRPGAMAEWIGRHEALRYFSWHCKMCRTATATIFAGGAKDTSQDSNRATKTSFTIKISQNWSKILNPKKLTLCEFDTYVPIPFCKHWPIAETTIDACRPIYLF